MPEETPEQKVAREAEDKRQQELDARIVAGVTAGLKPVIEKLSTREQPVAVTRAEPTTQIVRPSEEQIAQAQIDGNASELARLLKLQRAADSEERRRELSQLANQGSSAINSVSQRAALQDPTYKRYQKEVDAEIEKFKAINPGQMITPEHYAIATKIVRADHVDDEINERIEETRRQAREKEEALLPENQHHEDERPEKDPTTLIELIGDGDWRRQLREKSRQIGGRTEAEEIQVMQRKLGIKGDVGFQRLVNQTREIAKIEDEVGSGMGLDLDWIWTDKAKGEGHWVN